MRCAYCFREVTWSEWLFRGHLNARCEKVEEKITIKKGKKIKEVEEE